MSVASTGRFVWYELMTTDPEGAERFYSEVIGWKTQPFGEGGDYKMWVSGQGPLGGVMKLPEEAKAMGAPPNWMAHVTAANVDETVATIKSLGGRVYRGPASYPGVGRFAIVADPQGAVISVFQPESASEPHDTQKHGEFCWNELVTTDVDAAFGYYQAVLGWTKQSDMDMGPMGVYRIFGAGEKSLGGMMNKPPGMEMPPAWLYYIQVDDLESATARATTHGAKVLNGPMDVPGGRITQLLDPQGAAFALHASVAAPQT